MKTKIGLVLGGGGTKGAYQLGALLAMKRHKLLPLIKVASANSIGSLNLLLLLSENLEHGIDIWKTINTETILTKKPIVSILKNINTFGIFSRDGLIKLIEEYIDFDKVSNSSINAFVAATKIKKNVNSATYFKLNNESKDSIIKYVLSSSAIPYVFEPIFINGEKYFDGYKYANEPFEPVVKEKLDLIFFIPLNLKYQIKEEYKICPIVDFKSTIFENVKAADAIKVEPATIQERMSKGYQVADELITKLRKDSIIVITFKEKVRYLIKKIFRKLPKSQDTYTLD